MPKITIYVYILFFLFKVNYDSKNENTCTCMYHLFYTVDLTHHFGDNQCGASTTDRMVDDENSHKIDSAEMFE